MASLEFGFARELLFRWAPMPENALVSHTQAYGTGVGVSRDSDRDGRDTHAQVDGSLGTGICGLIGGDFHGEVAEGHFGAPAEPTSERNHPQWSPSPYFPAAAGQLS